ncbi:myb-binding protein 1A [Anopheles maculipalpis]|uniref:myb-binding protein 1A n=1 Tax=Anopheles maculipalpis TaxID=1496333 RepID=UPI0021591F3A|nr:myb-binding protein 1A [Anopheles maculipalpis]
MKEQPGRKAGMLMDKSVFGYFKHFINEDDGIRVNGACSLIEFLTKGKSHTAQQNGSGDVAEEMSAPKSAETAYALKRLVRGVGSTLNASRIGFFTALVGLLEQLKCKELECPAVTELLGLIKTELTDSERGDKEDKKEKVNLELRIGKILVCGAIIKSGLIDSATEQELQSVLKTMKKNMHEMLTPLVYAFLNELTNRLDAAKFSKVFWPVFEEVLNVPKENHTIDSVFFLLQLSIGPHKKLINSKYFERNFGVPNLLHEDNFAFLAKLLFGVGSTMGINHPFYECLLEQLSKKNAMVPFWRDTIVPVLEQETDDKPKHRNLIVLRMAISVLGRMEDYALVPEVLHPTFVKFLVNDLKNRSKYSEDVRNLYQEVCTTLLGCYPKMQDESARLATFRRLMNAPGSILIDKYANCKLLQNLLVSLSAPSLQSIAAELQTFILDESTGTNAERSYAAQVLQRILSMRQLASAADSSDGKQEEMEKWHQEMVQFFLTLGVFYTKDGVKVLKGTKSDKAISSELATMMRGMFFHSLEHRHAKLANERAFLLSIVRHVDELLRTNGVKSLRSPLTDEQLNCWHKMFATVASDSPNKKQSKKQTRGEETTQCDTVFHILLMHMGLHLFSDPEVASSSIMELECVMKRIEEKAKLRRQSTSNGGMTNGKNKKKSSSELEYELEPAEPEWIEVVVDLFLNLLSQNSHLLRKVIGHLFPHLSGEITLPALNQILSVINLKDKSNPLAMNGEDEEEEEEDEENGSEAEEEVDEDGKDSAADESGVESDDDPNEENDDDDEEEEDDDDEDIMGDEEEEENISDTMRQTIQAALGGANPETDTESVDLDDLDEEQGRKLDVALSAAFRAFRKSKPSRKRKGPTKVEKQMDTVLTHFRMRVLDLIDAYLKQEPDMLLCLELMLYIFEMLPVGLREESKYGAILKRYIHIFNTLIRIKKFKRDAAGVRMEQLDQILRDLIEKVAKGVAFPERNEYLLKACQFIVICSQVLAKQEAGRESNAVDRTFGELLTEFISNRNPSLAFGVFQNLFRMQWSGVWHLVDKLVSGGLKLSSVRSIRRIQTLQLLRELLRNRRLINADQPRSGTALRNICNEALAPYVTELEAAVSAGDRSIGQNELYELLMVLHEVKNHSPMVSNAGDKKKVDKKSELLKWDTIGAQVQSMRLFALNSQTMSTYRRFCQRLNLSPVSNEGLPALKEAGSNGVTVEMSSEEKPAVNGVTPKKGNAKKRKSETKKEANEEEDPLMNGSVDEEENDQPSETANQSDKRKRKKGKKVPSSVVNDTNGVEPTVLNGDHQSEDAKPKRKRKNQLNGGDDGDITESSTKKEKRRRKEARLQAASQGMEGISFARVVQLE